MHVELFVVGDLQTNCYVVVNSDERLCLVIDPGSGSAKPISDYIRRNRLELKNIILTHGHFDHMLGAADLKEAFNARVIIHERDAICLSSSQESLYMSILSEPYHACEPDKTITGGEYTNMGDIQIKFIHTPGHSPGSMCIEIGNCLFTGDTLLKGGCGRTDLKGGDASLLKRSLAIISTLRGDYIVYPGHGETTTLKFERENNTAIFDALNKGNTF